MASPNLESQRNREVLRTSYMAFLLRCWLEETNGEPAWRFTLIQGGNKGSKQGFASLEAAFTYVQQILNESETNTLGEKRS